MAKSEPKLVAADSTNITTNPAAAVTTTDPTNITDPAVVTTDPATATKSEPNLVDTADVAHPIPVDLAGGGDKVILPTDDEMAAIGANKGEPDPRIDQALGIFADLTALAVSPSEVIAAKEIMTTMSVRRPKRNEFVMAQDITWTTFLYQDDDDGELYFIEPAMRPYFIAGTVVKVLVPAVNQLGLPFIWPVPADDGQTSRKNTWNQSHREAYQQAKVQWTKMVSDRVSRQYRVYGATGKLPAPKFCPLPFNQQVALAFRGISTVSDTEHPVLRAQRGDIP